MLEALVVSGDKFFCADDARVGKISCTVPETIGLVYCEILLGLFFKRFFSYSASASLVVCTLFITQQSKV